MNTTVVHCRREYSARKHSTAMREDWVSDLFPRLRLSRRMPCLDTSRGVGPPRRPSLIPTTTIFGPDAMPGHIAARCSKAPVISHILVSLFRARCHVRTHPPALLQSVRHITFPSFTFSSAMSIQNTTSGAAPSRLTFFISTFLMFHPVVMPGHIGWPLP